MIIDWFVLLTPVLLFAVVAVLQFIGCFIKPDPPPPPRVDNVGLSPGTVCGTSTLTVTGQHFSMDAKIQWNGAYLPTTFDSNTQLRADIALEDASLTSAQVTVDRSGINYPGDVSAPFTFNFTVNPGGPNFVNLGTLPPGVNNNDPVGVFQNINFPGWIWFRDTTNQTAIYFDSVGTTRTLAFANGTRIVQGLLLRNSNLTLPITVTAQDDRGESAPPLGLAGGEIKTLDTGWSKCGQTVTITLDAPSNEVGIVQLTYLGPPA
jgi:IPT/TIG domain